MFNGVESSIAKHISITFHLAVKLYPWSYNFSFLFLYHNYLNKYSVQEQHLEFIFK